MTVEELIASKLMRDFPIKTVLEAIELAKDSDENSVMRGRWQDDAEGYPSYLLSSIMVSVRLFTEKNVTNK